MKDCCTNENENGKKIKFDLDKLDGLICYCFNHSKKELYNAVKSRKEDIIVTDIKEKMKDPGCFCETSNPTGKCCLKDVLAFIKAVKQP
jgi:hypothetical protein